nr:hypothetical protein Q903MT_gene1447 [Picea sitchensis]
MILRIYTIDWQPAFRHSTKHLSPKVLLFLDKTGCRGRYSSSSYSYLLGSSAPFACLFPLQLTVLWIERFLRESLLRFLSLCAELTQSSIETFTYALVPANALS